MTSTTPLTMEALDLRLLASNGCIPAGSWPDGKALRLEVGVEVGVEGTVVSAALDASIARVKSLGGSRLCSPTPAPMSMRGIAGNKKRSS